MNKITNFLVTCIRAFSGIILLLLVVIIWLMGLWFKTVVTTVTWIELKLTRLMKKTFGEDIEEL